MLQKGNPVTHRPSISLAASAPFIATLAVATSVLASPAPAADALSIRDLAPDTALLVVGADDIRGTIARLGPTALGKLWNDPSLAEEVKAIREAFSEGLREAATEAGVEEGDITWPASGGAAVLVDISDDTGLPTIDFVFFIDWADEAAKASKFLGALIERAEKAAKEGGQEVRMEEIRGRKVLVTKAPTEEELDGEMDDEDEFGGMDEFGMLGLPDLGEPEMSIAIDGGRLLLASSPSTMDMLLARVDGDRAKAVGESSTFREAVELSGGTQDVYAVLSTEAAQPIFGMMPQLMLVEPLIKQVVGDIKAWSFGAHAKDGVLEQCAGIYMPNGKGGLLGLVDESSAPSAPPAIVPSDALSYGRLNVRFDRIVEVLDGVMGGMPAEQSEMIAPMLDMYRPAMRAAFAALGPAVHLWGREPDPNDPLASGTVTAISMKGDKESAAAVSDLLNLFGLGLAPRDFNGMTILSDEFSPFAVGIGGGYMVIGSSGDVEAALRAVDAKGEGLAGDADFARSLASMPKEPVVGMAWWDIVRQMTSTMRMLEGLEQQLGGMTGFDADDAIPGMEVLGTDLPDTDALMKLFRSEEAMKRCFGDATLSFSSTAKGYSTSYRWMPGRAE